MVGLLKDRNAIERESIIKAIASDVQSDLAPGLMPEGRLSFPQEAHVATANRAP
jgi:hypothetical protein